MVELNGSQVALYKRTSLNIDSAVIGLLQLLDKKKVFKVTVVTVKANRKQAKALFLAQEGLVMKEMKKKKNIRDFLLSCSSFLINTIDMAVIYSALVFVPFSFRLFLLTNSCVQQIHTEEIRKMKIKQRMYWIWRWKCQWIKSFE